MISLLNFEHLFLKFPNIKKIMTDEVIWNPYDTMRDSFLGFCREKIPYLANAGEITLRKLYYRSVQRLYGPMQNLFEAGEQCSCIFVILSGCIDIVIQDRKSTRLNSSHSQ